MKLKLGGIMFRGEECYEPRIYFLKQAIKKYGLLFGVAVVMSFYDYVHSGMGAKVALNIGLVVLTYFLIKYAYRNEKETYLEYYRLSSQAIDEQLANGTMTGPLNKGTKAIAAFKLYQASGEIEDKHPSKKQLMINICVVSFLVTTIILTLLKY